jgi:AraC-like DNA-binding protein
MTAHDTCAEIAALLHPVPARDSENDDGYADIAEQILREREDLAEELRNSWTEGGIDPLLATLEDLRGQRLRLESDMRLLIAYGRRFTHPRPYKLIDIARAAGMSISGVRTAYDSDEIDQAVGILHRQPAGPPASAGDD